MARIRSQKAQASMEFLTNYGIMFAIVILAVTAFLSYTGAFYEFLPVKCDAGGSFDCNVDVQEAGVQFELRNKYDQTITIKKVEFQFDEYDNSLLTTCRFVGEVNIPPNSWARLDTTDNCVFAKKGRKAKIIPTITYSLRGSNIDFVAEGEIITS